VNSVHKIKSCFSWHSSRLTEWKFRCCNYNSITTTLHNVTTLK